MDLWGNLKDFSLPDVIQLVGFGRKTGVLSVEYATGSSLLYFQEGHVVHAQNGTVEGEEAVYELFRVQEGQFRFQADKEAPCKTIHMDPTNLVMEAARLMDEASRQEEEVHKVPPPDSAVAKAAEPEPEMQAAAGQKSEPELQQVGEEQETASEEGEYFSADNLLPDGDLFDVEFEGASTEAETPGLSAGEVRSQIRALLEERFNRDAKRLMQAVEKCGDTFEDFEQLSVRIVRFVSAFVDPASANALGEEIREIIDRLDINF